MEAEKRKREKGGGEGYESYERGVMVEKRRLMIIKYEMWEIGSKEKKKRIGRREKN